jgi:hypothetical protein
MSGSDDQLAPVIDMDVARRRRRLKFLTDCRAEIREHCRAMGTNADRVAAAYLAREWRPVVALADMEASDVVALLVVVRDRHERYLRGLMQPRSGRGRLARCDRRPGQDTMSDRIGA